MPTCFEAIHPALSKCGIYVRGCSSTLRINYRTTEEIRKHAIALLKGISSDDLDKGSDPGEKCRSRTHGEKPIIRNFNNANVTVQHPVKGTLIFGQNRENKISVSSLL